jgi:hypothetical protein
MRPFILSYCHVVFVFVSFSFCVSNVNERFALLFCAMWLFSVISLQLTVISTADYLAFSVLLWSFRQNHCSYLSVISVIGH